MNAKNQKTGLQSPFAKAAAEQAINYLGICLDFTVHATNPALQPFAAGHCLVAGTQASHRKPQQHASLKK